MAIDPNTLEWGYRTYLDGNSSDQKANYSFNFNSGGQEYTFIPQSVIEKGVDTGDKNYVFPAFLNKDNLTKLGETGQYVDLNGVSWYGDYLKDNVGASTKGFLVPAGSFDFGVPKIVPNNVKGVGTTKEGPAYILETPEGKVGQYLASDGKVTTLTKTGGSSLLGNALGDWFDDFTKSTGIQGVAGEVNDFFQTDLGKAIKLAALASNVYNIATAPAADPNAVGGVTGPDNIDVGGGWSPATGATAAELEAARLALEPAPVTPEYVAPAPAPTVDAITNDIANSADNIDAGGGFNSATGTGDAATAAAASANPPVMPTVDSVISNIAGNSDRAALNSNAGYGDTMTSAQIDAYDKAVAAGLSVSDALNYARLGLLVNAFVGDPLGLSGSQPSGTAAPTGFAQVDIPTEWKSPTYAAPSAPIDLNSIFSNQNMLGGTQWQNLPSQQNMSFNDIFAAGQQQTPMGQPIDLNQIVSSILGQTATSQKPA
jgi:hypothetical protein